MDKKVKHIKKFLKLIKTVNGFTVLFLTIHNIIFSLMETNNQAKECEEVKKVKKVGHVKMSVM